MEAQLPALSHSATVPAIPMTTNRDLLSMETTTPTTVLPGPTTPALPALVEIPSDLPSKSLPMLTCTPAGASFPSTSPLLLTRLLAGRRCPWVFVVEAVSRIAHAALCTLLILFSKNSARPSRATRYKLHRSAQNAAKDNHIQETATRLHTLPNLHPFIHSICLSKGLRPVGLCARDGLYTIYPCTPGAMHQLVFIPSLYATTFCACPPSRDLILALALDNCTRSIDASKWHRRTTA